MNYAIKYLKVKLQDGLYALVAQELIEGTTIDNYFWNGSALLPTLSLQVIKGDGSYLVDEIKNIQVLQEHYEIDDTDFLKEFYLSEFQDKIFLVEIQNDVVIKIPIELKKLRSYVPKSEITSFGDDPLVALNPAAIKELLKLNDIGAVREKLLSYNDLLEIYHQAAQSHGLTNIIIENGKVQRVSSKSQQLTKK